MNNYLEIYRKKTKSTKCDNSQTSALITKAIGNTIVFHRRLEKDIECNLIIDNKNEGRGTAIIYSWVKDDLQVGDYFVWKNKYIFLVTDQENNVLLDTNIYKFKARECNIKFEYGTDEEWKTKSTHFQDAVFIGKNSTRIDTNLENSSVPRVNALDESMMIFSGINIPRFESVKIYDSQWTVLEWDRFTAMPIIYSTVKEVAPTHEEDKPSPSPTPIVYKSGVEYEFDTEDFYFKSEDVAAKKRNETKIVIEMPYNKPYIDIELKRGGNIITKRIEIEK